MMNGSQKGVSDVVGIGIGYPATDPICLKPCQLPMTMTACPGAGPATIGVSTMGTRFWGLSQYTFNKVCME